MVDVGSLEEDAVVLDEDVSEEELPDGLNAAAILGFDDRNPAVTSPTGHPLVQGFDLQQPMKGGDVYAQVYHLLPVGHS